MTQQGIIKKLLPDGMAEIEVTRRSSCGHDCAKCGGCGGLETQTLYVTARNKVEAKVGERVLIEGETKQVLGLAGLMYIFPVVLVFIGFAVGALLKKGEGISALCGGTGLILGVLAGAMYSRRMEKRNDVPFEITRRM